MKISLLIAAAMVAASSAAKAAVEIDQQNIAVVVPGTRLGTSSLYYQPSFAPSRLGQMQSITAGRTGTLTAVDLQLYRVSSANLALSFSVSLLDGEPGATGAIAPLGTLNFTRSDLPTIESVQAGSFFTVDLSSLAYRVTTGSKFSILISMPPMTTGATSPTVTGPSWAFGLEREQADGSFTPEFLSYAGGFTTVIESDGTRIVTGADRGFRTYVDVTAVPEPAAWMTMILGFGAAGASMRRRSRRAAERLIGS